MRSPRDVWPDEHALVHLVQGAQEGRPGALDALLVKVRRSFIAYLAPILGRDDAEDTAQLALLSIMRALPRIDPDRALSYVIAVAHNRLGKARRRLALAQRRLRSLDLALAVESPAGADGDADYHELVRALPASLATLPPPPPGLPLEPPPPA